MSNMQIRRARKEDVPQIVALYAQDKLGRLREDVSSGEKGSGKNAPRISAKYFKAFSNIEKDSNQELMVMVLKQRPQEIIATLQLSFIPYLTYRGGVRAQIEAVRVRGDQRGAGLGEKFFQWAIERSKEKGAHLVQLTSDKQRPDAIRFYEKLGFKSTHEGMKFHHHPDQQQGRSKL